MELAEGYIACVAGRRREPYGIALYLSNDDGRSWNCHEPLAVRSNLPNRDLGYPSVAQRANGSLFIAYYAQDSEGVTGIHASVVGPDAIGRCEKERSHGQS